MTCQSCGNRPAKETLKHNGKALRVCRQCANAIRERRKGQTNS